MAPTITTVESLTTNKRSPRLVDDYFLKGIALDSRVLIIEGISGSGKDMFQAYLKKKLRDRDVYDYSEGELLQSWNQLQIEGIFKLRVKFMKLFVNHIKDTLGREENAVFLLNRFHLSAYVMTIIPQPKLEREYDEIVNVLRTLPVHVFILQLNKDEIEQRSLHPERSVAWHKFQEQIVKRDGFRNRLERYIWQQRLMLEAAESQRIPYSVIRFSAEPETVTGRSGAPKEPHIVLGNVRPIFENVKLSQMKRRLPKVGQRDN